MEVIRTTGRRKTSVARIGLATGKGEIKVNKRLLEEYFSTEILRVAVKEPLHQVDGEDKYDIWVNVKGGGLKGQAEAIQLAIARALCEVNPKYRPQLKKEGMRLLTRDPRKTERKKYGHKKARRSFQFSKR
ncbi:MAG: 30S ribosomal protein S9 [Cytophagales bacterium]|nr:30S ribosomal protein S9 [Cytophagales bacterium]